VAEPIEIGIKMRADTSAISGDVAKAKSQIDSAGGDSADKATEATKKQAAATSELGEKLKGVKKTYGEQIEVVQGLLGKVFAVGAIATTFYKIGESISTFVIDRLTSARDKMADFNRELDKSDAKAAQSRVADKIQEINEKLSDQASVTSVLLNSMLIQTFGSTFGEDLITQQNKLNEMLKGLSNRVRGEKQRADAKAAEEAAAKEQEERAKQLEKLNDLNAQAIMDGLGEEERIVADAEAKILEIRKAFNALAKADRLAQVEATQAAIRSIEDQAIAEIKKRQKEAADAAAKKAEDDRKKEEEWQNDLRKWYQEQEEADRKRAEAAQKARDAWVQSLKAIRAEINSTFGGEAAASITQFGAQLQIMGWQASGNMNRIVVEGVG
jgi:hypothetical protein